METRTQRDTRGTEIKRLLQRQYPQASFRVRLSKYSMGESIHVKTDLLLAYPDDPRQTWLDLDNRSRRGEVLTPTEWAQLHEHHRIRTANNETSDTLSRLLRAYESIDRDSVTGEILSGGNTYVFIERLATKEAIT